MISDCSKILINNIFHLNNIIMVTLIGLVSYLNISKCILEFLTDIDIHNVRLVDRAIGHVVKVNISHFIMDNLGKDKVIKKYFELDENTKSINIFTSKTRSIDLILEVLKIRRDIKRMEIL